MIRTLSFTGQVADANASAVAAAASAAAAEDDRAATADLVASVSASAAASETSLLETARIGRISAPVTGSSFAHATYHWGEALPWDCRIIGIGGFGLNGGGTIKLKKADRSGTTITQSGSDVDAVIPAGAFVLTEADTGSFTAFTATAGQLLGVFAGGTTGSDQKLGFTSNTADTGGYYNTSAGSGNNTTNYTDATAATASRLEFYFVIARVKPTSAVTIANEQTLADHTQQIFPLRKAGMTPLQYYIGRSGTPNGADGLASFKTRMSWQRAISDGWISSIVMDANASGSLYVWCGTVPAGGGTFTPLRSTVLSIPGSGVQTLTPDPPLRIKKGEYIAYFSEQLTYTATLANGGAFWSIDGNLSTWTTGTGTTAQRMEISFLIDYDQQGLVGTQSVMPGDLLAQDDRVAPTDVTVWWSNGESLSKGTEGEGFVYTAVNTVEMFAQGIRAARSGTLSGGLSNNGGTASKTAAVERSSNSGNSYAYDTETGQDRGNTGLVQMADSVINLARLRSGIAPANNTIFLGCDAHGGYRIDQYNYNSRWFHLGDENARDCVALYQADSKTPKCLIVFAAYGNNVGQGIYLSDDETVVNLTAATKDAFKAVMKNQIRNKTQELQTIFGQADQIHWLVTSVSAVTKGTGSISGLARDGIQQQVVTELSRELSNFHVIGSDFECEKTTADNAHMNAVGYTRMRLMCDRAAYEIVYLNRRPSDMVIPLGATWSGTTVTQYYWSVNPLTTDTASVTGMTRLGVGIKVAGSTATLASDPTVDNAPADGWSEYVRTITATLSAAPTSGDVVQFRLGLDYGRSTGAGGRTDEAIHNFRTTATASHTVDGSPMTIHWWIPAHATTAREV
jgi:hypothetical protein